MSHDQGLNRRFQSIFNQIFKNVILILTFSRLMRKIKIVTNITERFEKQLLSPKRYNI